MENPIANYFSARVPRYTSYPTAPYFSTEVGAERYASWLESLDASEPVSLYLHVPFCKRMCWYCGCNMRVVARYDPIGAYVTALIQEIELVARIAPRGLTVRHIHWGGGTPTSLAPGDFLRVDDALRRNFEIAKDAEIAAELDPRTFTADVAAALARIGCNRASLGVQEFDERVQAAINRLQPLPMVEASTDLLRENGITALNFDLMYGLPHQTAKTLGTSVAKAVSLRPDRIALFGYAHVPWMAKNQRLIPEAALPGPWERFEQSQAAGRSLEDLGYRRIGLDHFAKPNDSLAVAAREGRLRRNFQGYTSDDATTLIAFGASAISAMPQGYVQNIVETGAYTRAVAEEGRLPVAKGLALKGEDAMRRAIIERLMCDLEVDLDEIRLRHRPDCFGFPEELARLRPLQSEGLVELSGAHVRVTEAGRPALRVICAVFDTYFGAHSQERHAAAV
jgi:oxygen-independent coproporphyrinogen-3 oxidase